MPVKSRFIITEKAGAWVAGKRSPGAGKEIQLTIEQAKYPLINGEIEAPVKKTEAKPTKPEGESSALAASDTNTASPKRTSTKA